MNEQQYKNLLIKAQEESLVEYVVQNKITNERGDPIEFRNHYFLYDIYEDWTPKQAILKGSQIGGSIMMVQKALYAAKMRGYNVIYTLPSYQFIRKFVPDKVNKLVKKNKDTYGTWIGTDKDTLDQKQVGDRVIYFDSAFAHESQIAQIAQGISLTSDLNIHDEANRSSLEMIAQYRSRLDYSDYKGTWIFSNPTFPKVGVSEAWDNSDQKHWFIKCEHCGKQQYMDWDKNVDMEKMTYVCQKCNKELSDDNRRVGKWVKKWQDKDTSGYWINQMMAPWKSAEELVMLYNDPKTTKQYFYNFALGLPYVGSDVVVDRDLILRNITTKECDKEGVCMGVDVGIEKHVVVGTSDGVFKMFKTKDWETIEREFLKYDAVMVIDALPDLTEPRKLVEKYKGRVFINYYKEGTTIRDEAEFKKDRHYGTVFTDRTRMIEFAIDQLVEGKTRFYLTAEELGEYIEHWETMYRYETKDRLGNPVVRWESANDNDHFVHAHIYYLVAVDRYTSGQGLVFKEPSSKLIRGKKYDDKAPTVEEFVGKPGKDWRYI